MSDFLDKAGPVIVIGAGFSVVTLSVVPNVVVIYIRSEDTDKLGYKHCHANLDLINIMG